MHVLKVIFIFWTVFFSTIINRSTTLILISFQTTSQNTEQLFLMKSGKSNVKKQPFVHLLWKQTTQPKLIILLSFSTHEMHSPLKTILAFSFIGKLQKSCLCDFYWATLYSKRCTKIGQSLLDLALVLHSINMSVCWPCLWKVVG